jgi:phosphoribosylaminoimidazole-succinocarboxamide synthase
MSVQALEAIQFQFKNQTKFYRGKVRDVYTISDKYLVMIASDRISAFDVVLPKGIPYKGQVLNQTAKYCLEFTKDIIPNWLLASPHENVSVGLKCEPFKVEMVIRGYLAGHAARTYASGGRVLCGVTLAEGLKENDKLPTPIITPTTKADFGHDEDISKAEIIKQGIVSETHYNQLEAYTHALYKRGSEMAAEQGLILVDTKYEFGLHEGKIYLMDEIHTPDSSRYFYRNGYEQRQERGEDQKQLSKEFVRQWLINNDFQGKEGQAIPEMNDTWINEISDRYIELYEQVTGLAFVKTNYDNKNASIENAVNQYITINNL